MKESNRNNGRVSIELVDDPPDRDRNSFFDSNSPEFSPPKENVTNKKRPWKRKLIGCAVDVTLDPFRPLRKIEMAAVSCPAERFGQFQGLPVTLKVCQ